MKRTIAVAAAVLAAAIGVSACGSGNSGPTLHSAQDVADALSAHNFGVSKITRSVNQLGLINIGGVGYDVTITPTKNATAKFKSKITYFDSHADLKAWSALSNAFRGIAIVGDRYAVSLPTDTKGIAAQSKALAPKVARALDGEVVVPKAPGSPKSPATTYTPCGVLGPACPVTPKASSTRSHPTPETTATTGGNKCQHRRIILGSC